jgi:hypothetical protein
MPKKEKKEAGRPRSIDADMEASIIKDVSEGCTESAAFGSLGIPDRTYYDHKVARPQFAQAIQNARKSAHRAVTRMLIKEAINGKIAAIIFWLKNRFPEEWRDVHNLAGEKGGPIQIEHIEKQRKDLKAILDGDPELRVAALKIGQALAKELDELDKSES